MGPRSAAGAGGASRPEQPEHAWPGPHQSRRAQPSHPAHQSHRLHRLLALAVALTAVAVLALRAYAMPALSGWDAPQYLAMGGRWFAGDHAALWTGLVAPGLPLLLGALLELGLGPAGAHRVAAALSHLALLAGALPFAYALGRELGSTRDRALTHALLVTLLLTTTPALASLSSEPWTDHLSLAPMLLALAALRRVGAARGAGGRRVAAALGLLCAASYLMRYVALTPVLLIVAAATLVLVAGARAGELGVREVALRCGLCAWPLVLSVLCVTVQLSGPDFGFSYGANTQVAGNLALDIDRTTLRPDDPLAHVLNPDGTVGYAHTAPDDPYIFNWYRGFSLERYRAHAPMSLRVRERLADLPGSLATFAGHVVEVNPVPGFTFFFATLLWLGLLIGAARGSVLMWCATAICGLTLGGVYLVYLRDPRYILGPQIFVLSALPAAAQRGLEALRGQCPRRALHIATGVAAAAALLLWAGSNALQLPSALGLGTLLRGERTAQVALHAALDRHLSARPGNTTNTTSTANTANTGPRAGGLPFSNPVVASNKPGVAVRNGGQWFPTPWVTVSEAEHRAADAATRAAWLGRTLEALRAGRVTHLVILAEDRHARALQPLFGDPGALQGELELLAEIPAAAAGDTRGVPFAARIFAVTPR